MANTKINLNNVSLLVFIWFLSFVLFIIPIKLGSPYIDEIGFFIPTLADLFFGSWPALGICYLSLFLFLIIASDFFILKKQISINLNIINILMALFVFFCVLSILTSANKHSSYINSMILLSSALAFSASKKIAGYKSDMINDTIIKAVLTSAVFVAVTGIHQYYYGLDEMRGMIDVESLKKMAVLYKNSDPQNYSLYLRLMSNRVFSTFVYPNSLSGYLCMVIPFLIEFFRMDKARFLKIYLHTALVSTVIVGIWFLLQSPASFIPLSFLCALLFPLSIIFCVILSGSKGGLVTIALMCCVYLSFLVIKKFNKKYLLAILSAIAVICIATVIFVTSSKPSRLNSFYARMDYWESTIKMIKDAPVFGFGIGCYGNVYPQYRKPQAEETQFAHNNYLQIFCETGYPGGISYLLLIVVPLLLFMRKYAKPDKNHLYSASGFSLLAFFIHGWVDFDLYIPALSFYAFFMLGIVVSGIDGVKINTGFRNIIIKIFGFILCCFIFVYCLIYLNNQIKSQLYYDLAKDMFYEKKELKNTVDLLKRAISIDKNNGKLYFMLGNVYLSLNNFKEAVYNYETAVKNDSRRASYRYGLSQALLKSGDHENIKKAVKELDNVLKYNPNKPIDRY